MKSKFKAMVLGSVLTGAVLVFSAWAPNANDGEQGGVWTAPAPAPAKKMVNPLKGDAAATKSGKKLYKQMCAICHGDFGRGDGMAGASLTPRPANFTEVGIQGQTDGEIFWKLTEGKSPMAAYKAILKENQRWELVNYIRTFKK